MSLSLGTPTMKPRDEREAVDIGRRILGPAGQPLERLDWGNAGGVHVVHVRRPITDAVQALLPAWFLERPPIDLAGMRPLILK